MEENQKKTKDDMEEKVLYKDLKRINHRSQLRDSINEIAELIKSAGGVCENRSALLRDLLNNADCKQEHIPNHECCSGCTTKKVTEKRICRCMYYYMKKPEKCNECMLEEKWNNVGTIEVIDYERPTKYVLKNVGGMDLIIKDGEQKYAVEIKPSKSKETLARMFAEILTYTIEMEAAIEEKNIKPAICFFEDSEQMEEYKELRNEKNEALAYIMQFFVKVYYFKTKKNSADSNVTDFEICEIERYENER